jgi:hypothetical protein
LALDQALHHPHSEQLLEQHLLAKARLPLERPQHLHLELLLNNSNHLPLVLHLLLLHLVGLALRLPLHLVLRLHLLPRLELLVRLHLVGLELAQGLLHPAPLALPLLPLLLPLAFLVALLLALVLPLPQYLELRLHLLPPSLVPAVLRHLAVLVGVVLSLVEAVH